MTNTTVQAPTVEPFESGDDLRDLAIRQLQERRKFRTHLIVYVLVNSLLWLIWGILFAAGGPWFPWPVFPSVGWGIGLAFHASETYRAGLSEEEIRREVARLSGSS